MCRVVIIRQSQLYSNLSKSRSTSCGEWRNEFSYRDKSALSAAAAIGSPDLIDNVSKLNFSIKCCVRKHSQLLQVTMSSVVEDICELLDSYNGRDKVVRLACYTLKLYGCLKGEKAWQTAGSRLSSARLMLRLFDDIPMIRHTYNYGLGRHESSKTAAALGVLANMVDQVFLPVEKASWLHEVGVLKLSPQTAETLDTVSTALWAASLYISLIQTIRSLRQLSWSRQCLQNSSEGSTEAKRNLDVRLCLQAVTAGKLLLDITHAVSCLPTGWLWGDKIGSTKVAAIATTSSVVGIALYFAKKRMLK